MSKYVIKAKEEVSGFHELSLKKVNISGNIIGKFGNFEIEQTFINKRSKPLEVNYTFPITETAVVTGFVVKVGERVFHGVCKRKEEAREEYVDNLSSGNSAYLLEQDTANVFNVMVGKVLPNEEVKITIEYMEMLSAVDNKIRLIIPTLVNQRYKSAITDGLKYGKVDYTVDFNIKLQKALKYTSIEAINHVIECSEDEEGFVQIVAKNYDMSKDFVLDMHFTDALVSNAYYDNLPDSKNKVVLLNFMPEINEIDDRAKDYIFVVDVSGSMDCSSKIDKTKEALKRCLKELREEDEFNIIPFNHGYTYYQEKSINATKTNIANAIRYIDNLCADGGTEILDPLKFALYEKEENKVIIILTDGEVGNESEITNYISKNIYNSRLFAIGIDTSVNTAFIKAMAKAGNGKAEFIYPNEDMEEAIVRTFARIKTPMVNQIKIDCGNSKVLGLIKEENALFNHEFFQALVLLEDLQDDITLKGKFGDKILSWNISREDIKLCEDNIRLIYAKKQIDMYEEQIRSYEDDYYNQNASKMAEEYKKKIIELSCKYSIASKYTSFISVNEREEKVFEPTDFENITLSDRELYKDMAMGGNLMMDCVDTIRCCSKPLISSKKAKTSSYKGYSLEEPEEYLVEEDATQKIVESSLTDWKKFDALTFLLTIIYLNYSGSKRKLQNMIKEYFEEHQDKVEDENVQRMLMHMYQEEILGKTNAKKLLKGVFRAFVEIGNPPARNFADEVKYDDDNSKVLSTGESLRSLLRRELGI